MGTISFQLPEDLPDDLAEELSRGCVAGGPDNMPWPTAVRVEENRLYLRRAVEESGYLVVPWDIDGAGRLMGSSATLMERDKPYDLQVELARGKVNQVRCQAADWRSGGLQTSAALDQQVREAARAFGRAVTEAAPGEADAQAHLALGAGYRAAEQLVKSYVEQVFRIRHQRQPLLDTQLGCRLGAAVPQGPAAAALGRACNAVALPFSWNEVEPAENQLQWGPHDALLDWALGQGFQVTAGPLLDFCPARLPDWLWLWDRDLARLARFMSRFVEAVVKRYHGRVRRWQLTTASNGTNLLGLSEDEFLWLTVRLAEVAKQIDPSLELAVGVVQPWGEYMAVQERLHSPFIFADTLIRAGLNLAALDVELVMGVTPRGSYCRDTLEASRVLDLYALLGVPLRVTLGYPSGDGPDAAADPALRVDGGHWRGGFSPAVQADWASAFAALALCKPYVQGVTWVHSSDAEPHQFPHCGLVDAGGQPKPALPRLEELRQQYLR